MKDLSTRWISLVGDTSSAHAYGDALLQRWAEPHRRYHGLDHLRAVLGHLAAIVRAEPGTAADIEAVHLAAFFHDAVYDPTRQDNEARSAELAIGVLDDLAVPDERVREVARLIRLTASHAVEDGDGAGAVLSDADLAVLASDPEGYAAYAVAVREEYAHVPEPLFRAGRAHVLAALLEHDALFHTTSGRTWWEADARRNVGAELLLLSAQTDDAGGASADRLTEDA